MNREHADKARALAGLKGYITSLVAYPDGTPVTAEFVISAYRQLIQICSASRWASTTKPL